MRLQHVSTLYPAGLQEDVRGFYGGILGLTEKQTAIGERGAHLEPHSAWHVWGPALPVREPTPIPNRPRFLCADPFGNLVELTTIVGHYRR